MLGFIIPFKAKVKSKNWEVDCHFLANTLNSICNQLDNNYLVYVVYTDLPVNLTKNEKIIFIYFPYSFIDNEELKRVELKTDPNSEFVIDERMFDQGKRILFGCKKARKDGCNFFMSVDADDLISNRISSFISQNSKEKIGWFVNQGYLLKNGTPLLIKINKNMDYLNCSTHIIHESLIPEVNFNSNKIEDFSFFSSHGYLRERIRIIKNETLKPLPFKALIYFIHDSNWSGFGTSMKKKWFKTFGKYVIFGKFLNASIKREFGIRN